MQADLENFPAADPERFRAAIAQFDAVNSQDPTQETDRGLRCPRELLYARRLTDWVLRLNPAASEELRLAARSQHIARWKIPRQQFPAGKAGYLRWRNDLKKFHARIAGEILRDAGYPESVLRKVAALHLKSEFPKDPDSRTLEDALCLVFLQYQLSELAEKTAEETLLNALRKSWKKMTPPARALALALPLSPAETALIKKALESEI